MSDLFCKTNLTFLSGWIRYTDVSSINRLIENDNQGMNMTSLLFVSPFLETSRDGNFESIVKWFLDNHYFPDSLISLIKCILNEEKIEWKNIFSHEEISYYFFDKDIEKILNIIPEKYENLKKILFNQIKDLDKNCMPVLVIFGPEYYLDLLYPMLHFILNTVAQIFNTMQQWRDSGMSVFLRQTAPCEFLSQFEIKVVENIFDSSFYKINIKEKGFTAIFPADVKNVSLDRKFSKWRIFKSSV